MSNFAPVRRRRLFGPTLDVIIDGSVVSQPSVGQAGIDLGGGEYLIVNNSGLVYKWNGSAWSSVRATPIDPNDDDVRLFWQDANGNLYYSTTLGGALFRSTDEGVNWTSVLTFPNGAPSTDYACPMDGRGDTIWCAAYSAVSPGPVEGFYRSTDSGANWTDITANKPATLNRHSHGVYHDPYRDVLYWTHGDGGAASDIFYSTDDGDNFTAWGVTIQATTMAFTPEFGFYTADSSTDRNLYRFSTAGGATEVVFDFSTLPGFVSAPATAGVCWDYIQPLDNTLVFIYMNATTDAPIWYIGTNDGGNTWHQLNDGSLPGRTINRRFTNNCYPLRLGRSKYRSYDDGIIRKISVY